ncbi:MAG: gliding motility lipoprotein GldH [Ferruginibacter sp.]
MKFRSYHFSLIFFVAVVVLFTSCSTIDVFEKNTVIPDHRWQYNFQPTFDFTVSDTSVLYNIHVVIRHTYAYRYNNIWLNIGSQSPADSMRYQRFELLLGTDATGWEGTGMDDIWELRKPITKGPVKFNKAGNYKFSIAQMMRENPLPEILSIGVRVEKAK